MESPQADLLATIVECLLSVERRHPLRVGVDGVDGAGKTTLADALAASLQLSRPTIRASVDSFLHPLEHRYRHGRTPASYFEDAFDYDALHSELLDPLGPGGSRHYRTAVWAVRTETAVIQDAQRAPENAILIVDGVFLHRRELRRYWDFSVWLDVPFTVTVPRAIERDLPTSRYTAEVIRQRYNDRYVPAQKRYIEECTPHLQASLVIDNTNPLEPRRVVTQR